MHIFKTLEQLNNYIPSCIICKKTMQIIIEGRLAPTSTSKPKYRSGYQHVRLQMMLRDGLFVSKHKNHQIIIEASNNYVSRGFDLVGRLTVNYLDVIKMCPTCHFKIKASYRDGNIKNVPYFPALTISQEELHYTMKGGKDVYISKFYDRGDTLTGEGATIRLENKMMPPVPWDFDKFRDLAQLNKRIETIRLFH